VIFSMRTMILLLLLYSVNCLITSSKWTHRML
jgi:hypothetical protein